MKHSARLILLAGLVALVPACGSSSSSGGVASTGPAASPAKGENRTVSLAALVPGDSDSYAPDVSSDGRYVCFQSYAANLVPNDTNFRSDIFVKDLQTGIIERISVSTNQVQSNSDSYEPRISNDGRFVVFSSYASNLVPGDNNGRQDIFVRDLRDGTTVRASIGFLGAEANSDSYSPEISGDGRTVSFISYASNLVFFDFNGYPDVFAHTLGTGDTELVSIATGGVQSNGYTFGRPAVSIDGSRVAFASSASNLGPDAVQPWQIYDVFLRDRNAGTTTLMSTDAGSVTIANSDSYYPAISDDGSRVAMLSYATNLSGTAYSAILVKNVASGAILTASTDSNNQPALDYVDAYPSLSGDGNLVSFGAYDTSFTGGAPARVYTGPPDTNQSTDLFVKNLTTNELKMASNGNGPLYDGAYAYYSSLSASGTFLVFSAPGSGHVAGDSGYPYDIILRDLGVSSFTGVTYLPGITNGHNFRPSVSDDGTFVAFESLATSLVSGDSNGKRDIFVRDTAADATVRVSVDSFGAESNGDSHSASISSTGGYIAFASQATNLVAGDGNSLQDIFRRSQAVPATIRVSVDTGGADPDGPSANPAISGDGTQVAFESLATDLVLPAPTAGRRHIYVRDITAGTTLLISRDAGGAEANGDSFSPSISNDGRYIVFSSFGSNLVAGDTNAAPDVFLVDRNSDADGTFDEVGDFAIVRVSVDSSGAQANAGSYTPSISGNGSRVVFSSDATNLVSGDSNGVQDVFLRDLASGTTSRVSLTASGGEPDSSSAAPAISRNGRMVAYQSIASNIVADETLGLQDVFVRDLTLGTTVRASLSFLDGEADGESYLPAMSGDGVYVAFYSNATNIRNGDLNGYTDVFLRGPLFP